MKDFVEKVNEDSIYTRLFKIYDSEVEDGQIWNKNLLIQKYLNTYPKENNEEGRKLLESEYDRLVYNLMSYSKLIRMTNGQIVVRKTKQSQATEVSYKENDSNEDTSR